MLEEWDCSCLGSNFHTLLNEVQIISIIFGPNKLKYCINEEKISKWGKENVKIVIYHILVTLDLV